MKRTAAVIAATIVGCSSLVASAADAVRTSQATISGTIDAVSSREITITRTGGKVEKVPVNEVLSVRYDGEPQPLNSARNLIQSGRYQEALDELAKAQQEGKGLERTEIKQDVDFYKACAAAQSALSGSGDIATAGRQLLEFRANNPQSYHYFEATELLGDLLVANGSHGKALEYYDEVAGAPWPDFKMRALAAKGRSLRQENKIPEALAAFDEVLAAGAGQSGPLVQNQLNAATLGKAQCLADMQKYDEAITLVRNVIAAADPEDTVLRGRAYNALGNCHRRSGCDQGALLAFLHVDVLYYADPQAHAEALANLAELWLEVDQTDRAIAAKQTLQDRYKNSAWAKQ